MRTGWKRGLAAVGVSLAAAGLLMITGIVHLPWTARATSAPPLTPPGSAGAPATPAGSADPGPSSGSDPGSTPVPDPSSPPVPDPGPTAPEPPPRVPYTGPVEHIFFHPAVLYPELAFDGDSLSKGYDDYFVTVAEFKRIIDQLYRNNYILIDIHALYDVNQDRITRRELRLPEGKKPLILSIDDLNYYQYMRANGNAYKLVLDSQGQIATYSVTPQGQEVTSRDNEIVPILDQFVADHPDFSLDGAKGMINLTGYEGILGYRTQNTAAPGYGQEKEQALAVLKRLKETGWTFASHGWGHLDAVKIKESTLVRDTQRWRDEVGSLVGPTDIYVFPFGSSVRPGDPKFKDLQDAGFRFFCGVGPSPFLQVTPTYIQMDRRHIDGMAFRQGRKGLLPLFDAAQVIESAVRPK